MDIRKIHEQILFDAIKAASDEKTAAETVYGETGELSLENDSAWVKSAMGNLENRFDKDKVSISECAASAGTKWTKSWSF